jgi:hypothetical protein
MTYQLHRGGLARTVKGAEAKRKIARELHSTVIAAQGDRTTAEVAAVSLEAAKAWWTDLRVGRKAVHGTMLRYLDTCIALGKSRSALLMIPAIYVAYINERCDERDSRTRSA